MNDKILLGKPVSDNIYVILKKKIGKLLSKNIIPKLSVILVGDDPASKIYVTRKNKKFISMNCKSDLQHLNNDVTEEELIELIDKFNNNKKIHGILVQLPLPNHIDTNKILKHINPKKDVDGFHPENLGYLLQGNPRFIPCTPYGCLEILKYYDIQVESKNVVIVGRSNIVGKPLFALLSQKFKIGNATVTLCHSKTENLSQYTKAADILIAAIGKPNLITKDMVKKDSIIIDIGINRISDNSEKGYSIVGDVDYKNVLEKSSAITPVPGGVGPMTIAMLLYNTVKSAEEFI